MNLKKLLTLSLFVPTVSFATIVEFQTSHGNFQVNLHDQTTPKTVENFLKYVTNDRYDETIVHRVVPNFVVQGGGHYFDGENIKNIETYASVANEPVYSNVKGTIAMAKLSNLPHSATSQWFVNTTNNTELDTSNGGFTVFGEVIEGMDVIEAIDKLPLCGSIPMPNYSSTQCSSGEKPGATNFVNIYDVIIIDDAVNTADSLSPVKNTAINAGGGETPDNSSGGGGGTLWYLLGLATLTMSLRIKKLCK
ncbi:peptidylprolyl isomerase [Thalassotalea fusca]